MPIFKNYVVTMTSGTSFTGAIDLSRTYESVYLEIQSMVSNSEIHIYAADSSDGTYRPVYHPMLNSSTVGGNKFAISSAITNALVAVPSGLRYMKIHATAAAEDGQEYSLLCSDLGD